MKKLILPLLAFFSVSVFANATMPPLAAGTQFFVFNNINKYSFAKINGQFVPEPMLPNATKNFSWSHVKQNCDENSICVAQIWVAPVSNPNDRHLVGSVQANLVTKIATGISSDPHYSIHISNNFMGTVVAIIEPSTSG